MHRVLFYFHREKDAVMMLPIYRELMKDSSLRIGFCLSQKSWYYDQG